MSLALQKTVKNVRWVGSCSLLKKPIFSFWYQVVHRPQTKMSYGWLIGRALPLPVEPSILWTAKRVKCLQKRRLSDSAPSWFYRLFSGHSDSINAVPTKHWHFYGKLQSFDLDHKMNPFFWVMAVSKSDKPWTALYQFNEKWPGLSARDKILAANKAF